MTFCNEKLVYNFFHPLSLIACTELFRKSSCPAYTGNTHFVCVQGCLHMQNHLWLLVSVWESAYQENAAPAWGAFTCGLLGLREGACAWLRTQIQASSPLTTWMSPSRRAMQPFTPVLLDPALVPARPRCCAAIMPSGWQTLRQGQNDTCPGCCGRVLWERTAWGQSLTQVTLQTAAFRPFESVKRTSHGNS